MKYRDYEVEVILRERMTGYGRSVLMVTSAENIGKAMEEARQEFTALTGLPKTLIKEIKAAPIIPVSEETWEKLLKKVTKRQEEMKNIAGR